MVNYIAIAMVFLTLCILVSLAMFLCKKCRTTSAVESAKHEVVVVQPGVNPDAERVAERRL